MRNKFFKRAMSLAMSLCMVLSMGSIASADETVTESKLNLNLNVSRGEKILTAEVEIDKNAAPFQELQIKAKFNPNELEFKGIQAGGTDLALTASTAPNEKGALNVIATSAEPFAGKDVVYTAVFALKEGAPKTATVTLDQSWCEADVNEKVTCTTGTESKSLAVSGTVASDKTSEEDVSEATVSLFKGIGTSPLYRADSTASVYTVKDVAPGTYKMEVSKPHHASRFYTVVMGLEPLTQNAELHLLGDVDQNGEVNMNDFSTLYEHVVEIKKLKDYALACGDANEDGETNIADFDRLYAHLTETNPMW